jgi:hypothetical protein
MPYIQVDGATVVWDLKKQRPVITLKDPNRCGWQQPSSMWQTASRYCCSSIAG